MFLSLGTPAVPQSFSEGGRRACYHIRTMVKKITEFLEGFGVNVGVVFALVGLALMASAFFLLDLTTVRALSFAIATSPLWLPFVLFFIFFEWWMQYIQKYFNLQQGRVTLEILLPAEILKTPLAMELMLGHLWQTASPDNHIQTYWDGKNPPTFGLEIVSTGCHVHFYINTQTRKYKNIIEAQLYSQYPGIEIREVPIDYAAEIPQDLEGWEFFSMHFGLRKADAYPIKTYIEYGLEKEGIKEEEKTDPITQMLELLGCIGPHERIWIQILVSAHQALSFKRGSLRAKPDWRDDIKKEINTLAGRNEKGLGPAELEAQPRLTPGERHVIECLERSISKTPFNTAIRAVYAAKKGHYLPGERIGAIITSWFQYNDANLNSFSLKWRTDFDWNWWQDPFGKRRLAMKKRELDRYKRRYYYPEIATDGKFVMTTEELATIFHFPGSVAQTPTMERIPSARGEPPANLPVGAPPTGTA